MKTVVFFCFFFCAALLNRTVFSLICVCSTTRYPPDVLTWGQNTTAQLMAIHIYDLCRHPCQSTLNPDLCEHVCVHVTDCVSTSLWLSIYHKFIPTLAYCDWEIKRDARRKRLSSWVDVSGSWRQLDRQVKNRRTLPGPLPEKTVSKLRQISQRVPTCRHFPG